MLTKWISVTVSAAHREAFSAAQRRWEVVAAEPGFVGQVGGWGDGDSAHVIAFWTDAPAYQRFMARRHDQVVDQAGQVGTYDAIAVATGRVGFLLPGEAAALTDAVASACVLRIADCRSPARGRSTSCRHNARSGRPV